MVKRTDAIFRAVIRDQYTIESWLLFGALLQCFISFVLPARLALCLPVAYAAYRATLFTLTWIGFKKNQRANGLIMNHFTALPPSTVESPGTETIAILLLSFYSSHPLGHLAPGFRQFVSHHDKNMKAVYSAPGFLGSQGPLFASERLQGNTGTVMFYWRSADDAHQFAKTAVHTRAWKWVYQAPSYVGLAHELFECPAGSWENIFNNFPKHGMNRLKWEAGSKGDPLYVTVPGGVKARSKNRMRGQTVDGQEAEEES